MKNTKNLNLDKEIAATKLRLENLEAQKREFDNADPVEKIVLILTDELIGRRGHVLGVHFDDYRPNPSEEDKNIWRGKAKEMLETANGDYKAVIDFMILLDIVTDPR